MSNLLQVKTNFTAGCIGRNLYGRGDLSIFENGARTLENVIIHPTGGVSRRRGLAYIDRIDRKARLIPFEFNTEQTYLICICADEVRVYRDGACIKTLPSPWREEHLNSLNYTQSADTLLVVHPDVSPRQITRGDNEEWKIGEWEYYTKDGRVFCPFYNYYNHKAKINPRGTGGTITVLSETNIFTPDSVGSLINVRGGQIKISEYVSASEVKAVVNKGLSSTGETVDWEESAFSPQRGWPNSVKIVWLSAVPKVCPTGCGFQNRQICSILTSAPVWMMKQLSLAYCRIRSMSLRLLCRQGICWFSRPAPNGWSAAIR